MHIRSLPVFGDENGKFERIHFPQHSYNVADDMGIEPAACFLLVAARKQLLCSFLSLIDEDAVVDIQPEKVDGRMDEGKIALFDLHERPFASKRREDIIGIRPAEDGIGIKLPIALVLVANGSKVFLRGILRISLPHVDDDADLGTF